MDIIIWLPNSNNPRILLCMTIVAVICRDVWINSDSESIPIQFSIFCEFWVESITEEAEVNWVWIESSMCWIESESNLSIVKSKWIESELHCQESWPKQIKFTSSKIYPANFFFFAEPLIAVGLYHLSC